MTVLHESAYPRLKSSHSERELGEIYSPTSLELAFVIEKRKNTTARFVLLLLLKTS